MDWEKLSWDDPEDRMIESECEHYSASVSGDTLYTNAVGEAASFPLELIRELIAAYDADQSKGGE